MDKIRKIIRESFFEALDEEIFQEERISNKNASEEVENRRNFVGSHTYGEDLGGLGEMYVAYSYGEQHPLYLWYKDRWYHNNENYILPNGKANIWTIKHLNDLRPNNETQGRPTSFLKKMIQIFKDKHNLGSNSHSDEFPGED